MGAKLVEVVELVRVVELTRVAELTEVAELRKKVVGFEPWHGPKLNMDQVGEEVRHALGKNDVGTGCHQGHKSGSRNHPCLVPQVVYL